ncbi:DNA polymerase-4 [Clostridium cadaveris]|uniref:DNA polymerase IV n=1 Tax=Clostridium cadaveris TaxID=1529 RepID=A0A1I2L356_9CLOT|nr:DNA polymerase IV [Clostridium cadaveris]MDM8311615.1 DNA polymerase IV [Clostridium cadaveris]MDU4951640.1 DNA polymerase IV [Clostridium sp.]UFH64546.1 DNA polymerase IV [Clostridium cadaveris]SFF73754.1 DNA polymerase-4 [Clostridium cadaveris]
MDRTIMHIDMDAFFASVEVMDNPRLKGQPIIVGGTSQRGVVATCSYEARKYGVRSAMPVFKARELCPNGIFLPTRHYRYSEVSKYIFSIYNEVTPYVEPLSIDEAYLDISHLKENPIDIAKYIKGKIYRTTSLTLSVGISYNKFLAKLASDWNKPNGLKIITKYMVPEILFPLPVSKVYGLGKKSVSKLNNIGIFTVEELYNLSYDMFIELFGKSGVDIYYRIRGIDDRLVETIRERKSVGRETTLKNDTSDKEELKKYILCFSEEIERTLNIKNLSGKTITLKIKTSSFENHTRSKTLYKYICDKEDIYKEAEEILEGLNFQENIRLIGLSISSLEEKTLEQMSFF